MNLQAHLGELYDQFGEIISRITNGSLDPVVVGQSLQAIIDQSAKGASWLPPAWWRSPELQLERASQLWPERQLPEPPKEFVPQTSSEVLLLHVPASFSVLWEIVESPGGYDKISLVDFLNSDQRHLKLASPGGAHVHPVWVGFDPEHGRDKAASRFSQRSDMAAGEVLSALIQFPGWPASWGKGVSRPLLPGYRVKVNDAWLHTPAIDIGQEGLILKCLGTEVPHYGFTSPTVRVC